MNNKETKPAAVVVNDDPTQLGILSGLLAKAGVEARAFESAEAALTAMDPADPPDLVVTDLYMPGIDGWRFCRLLRSPEYEAFNEVPILVVSATFAGDHSEDISADVGADAFLPSPVDGKAFTAQIKALLTGKEQRRLPRALIVEDGKTLAGLLKKTFAANGYRADVALTVREAEAAFAKTPYDVAVLDYHLPDGTGDALLDALQTERPDCVCLMMTTDPTPALALDWMKRGAAAYLRKPFEPEFLIELCARARRERALLRAEDLLEVRTRELRERVKELTCINDVRRAVYENASVEDACRSIILHLIQAMQFPEITEVLIQTGAGAYASDGGVEGLTHGLHSDIRVNEEAWGRISIFYTQSRPFLPEEQQLAEAIAVILTRFVERKRAEEEKDRLLQAIEQAAETVVITDAEAKIQYVNPIFERLTGYSHAEAIGRNPRVLQSGEHDQAFYEKMWHQLLHGEVWRGRLVNKRKNGAVFEEYATISPIKNAAGQITNFVAVKRDVSREVLLEKQLQQARKMESIGTLAGGIAHDFNNILTAILGYAEMAKYDLPAESKASNRIDKVIRAGERAADLVRQILTFSRQGSQDLQTLMPAPIVKEALKMLRSSLPATTIIEEDIEVDCGFILADVTQVHQIVLNLCTNAFQALENEKGTISVKLQRVEVAAEEIAEDSGVEAGEFILLSVSDTGSGIDPSMIERIFEPYFTTKELGDGTGLGLAVVHGIMKRYHGFIRTESTLGKGTSFHVYIPVQKKRIVIIEEVEEVETQPTGRERILVVDDEETILELQEMMLKQLGYEVTAIADSQAALEKIRTHPDNFDLLITDQSMPNLSGAELAREVLKIKPRMPIIICTGYSSVLSEKKALSLGIKKYVDKPVKQKELARIVRQVLNK